MFYRKHDPGKLPHVATIMRSPKYKGSRWEVLRALEAKYGHAAVAECMGDVSEFAARRGQRSEELSPMDGHAHLDGVQPTFLEKEARRRKLNTNTILQSVLQDFGFDDEEDGEEEDEGEDEGEDEKEREEAERQEQERKEERNRENLLFLYLFVPF